ncbi:alpha/beta fold hydrolase [Roseomonas elaeocarpi]|uniref:Alpha/beta hydrolase n=1 Tax=Roseomonas elaeocarpi TaxID=907779 RepID=A0ABV6JX90_9PROT
MRRRLLALLLAVLAALPAQAQDRDVGATPSAQAAYESLFSAATLGPASRGPSAVLGWTQGYRGTVPNAAFAIAVAPNGGSIWRFVSGQPTPEAARDAALAGCREAQGRSLPGVECRILALNGAVDGHPVLQPAEARVGPLRASPLHEYHGPHAAAGVIVYSHGYGGPAADNRGNPTPAWLSAFNDLGWDVFRFDRAPGGDDLFRAVAALKEAVPQLHAMGYRQVVLAGQSRGGWQSLLAGAELPAEAVSAVIATAPAAHGTTDATHAGAREDWERLLAELPRGRLRVAVGLFDRDPFDPDPDWRAERLAEIGQERGAPTLALRPSRGRIEGHGGAGNLAFTGLYTGCFLALVLSPQPPEGLRQDPCPR